MEIKILNLNENPNLSQIRVRKQKREKSIKNLSKRINLTI